MSRGLKVASTEPVGGLSQRDTPRVPSTRSGRRARLCTGSARSVRFGVRFELDPTSDREEYHLTAVIGYTRVSTEEQGRSGLGLEAQHHVIASHAVSKGWEVIWLTDEGMSARSLARPALQEALAMLRDGHAGALVVSKLDRLSRSVQEFAGLLALARKQRWAVNALDVGVDTTTSGGELVANVMASVAQWERRVIGERTSLALQAAQARGVRVGRPRSLSKESEQCVFELRALGLSVARVAAQLNEEAVPTARGGKAWHATTVSRILKRTAEVR